MQMAFNKVEIACPVCASKSYQVFLEPTQSVLDPEKLYGAASGIRGTQRLVTCDGCGLVYENPRLPETAIIKGYEASQEAGHDSQYPYRVKSFLRALEAIASNIPRPGAKILDIGTAGGAFLEAAKQYGYDAYGMEPSQYLVTSGQRRGLQIQQGTIDRHNFKHGSFDMVCYWDVLEHVTDPVTAVIEAKKLLKPNGILLINYPDIGTLQAKLAGRKFWWILSVHLTHFSRRTIRELCQRTGLKPFYFSRYWQTLELGYLFNVAAHLGVPMAGIVAKHLPKWIARIEIPYYASQTTALARPVVN